MDNTILTPQDHIEQIRSEFKIGPDKTRILDSLNDSVSLLADNLNQKDTHFILELIQNAEDNFYLPNTDPDLIFSFLAQDPTNTPGADGALLIINNEIGFQPEHVSAICAAGKSTKRDKREGYIGEKGIGFKSVFKVTSQPYIFSNGYQFKFQDTKDLELGFRFIVPTWVNDIFDAIQPNLGKTCILLPLKGEMKAYVEEQLQQIAPETILFLKKLRALQININGERTAEVIRNDRAKPLVEVVTNQGETQYWVFEKEYPVPQNIIEEKREGIDSRVVSIAFPLTGPVSTSETIFAFLPTNTQGGFKFLVNADFVLATNREGIRENLPWNIWLRESIVPTFIEAFTNLLHSKKFRFFPYQFIPLSNTPRNSYFQPVAENIIANLQTASVIWTFDGKTLAKPGAVRLAPKNLRELIDIKTLPNQLVITPLIHSELEKEEYQPFLKAIGVKSLSSKEIINCLSDEGWVKNHQPEWFYKLYFYLSKHEWAGSNELENLKLVKTESGEIICGHSTWVYYPDQQSLEITRNYPEIIEFLDLKYVDRKLYKRISSNSPLFDWVKTVLGLEELNINNICNQLIGRLSEDINELEAKQVIRMTRFIRDHFEELNDDVIRQIESKLPLLLANGSIESPKYWSDTQPLVVPPSIDKITGWQILFSDPEDRVHMTILSDLYLKNETPESRKMWLKFFVALGATQYPLPRQSVDPFWGDQVPEGTLDHIKKWVSGEGSHSNMLTDWKAPKWLKQYTLHPSEDVDIKRSKALLHWLEYRLNEINMSLNRVRLVYKSRKYYYSASDPCLSEFAYCILNSAWFPSTKGPEIPGRVFLEKPEIREFFKNLIPYTMQDISSGVANYLKIKTSATAEEVLVLLHDMATAPVEKKNIKLVSRIYSFLSERWNKSIKDEFEKNAWIFTIKPSLAWINPKKAIWFNLPLGFDGTAYVDISSQYNEKLYSFFVKQLGIPDKLDDQSYAQAFINLGKISTPQADLVETALEKIFPALNKITKNLSRPDWWKDFIKEVKIWTQSDQFFSPSEVFIPDDNELQKKMEKAGVQFAWRPNKETFSDYLSLYEDLGVRSLIDHVIISPEIKKDFSEPQVTTNIHLTNGAKKAILYYLRNSSGNDPRRLYESLKKDGKLESLILTNEEQVSLLHTIFRINNKSAREDDAATFWDREKQRLLISVDHSMDELETEIPSAIARRLVNVQLAKDLENFIGRFLGSTPEKAERIIKKHNWSMPEEELVWIESILTPTETISGELMTEDEIERGVGFETETEIGAKNSTETVSRTDSVAGTGNRPGLGTGSGTSGSGTGGTGTGGTGTGGTGTGGTGTGGTGTGGTGTGGTGTGGTGTGGTGTGGTGTGGTGTGGTGTGGTGTGGTGTWHPRVGSYVERKEVSNTGGAHETSDRDRQIGDAGIIKILNYEESQGRKNAHFLGQTHEGWDIDSEESESEGVDAILGIKTIRRIEVKSKEGEWDGWGIGLTASEFEKALEFGDDYYLYVVENALDPNDTRPPYIFRNPVKMITDYRFDHQWKKFSIVESSEKD